MTYSKSEKHSLIVDDTKNRCTIDLQSETYSIGRDPKNSIVLNSNKISRYHATLLRIAISGTERYQFRIIDGNLQGRRSRNGFQVNTKKVLSHDLEDGDVINFGNSITITYRATVNNIETDLLELSSESAFSPEELEDSYTTCFLGDANQSTLERRVKQTLNLSTEERYASIQQSLERLASFPELFSNPIIEIDFEGKITYLNPAALRQFPTLKKEKSKHPILAGVASLIGIGSQEQYLREVRIGERIFEQSINLISINQLIRCYITDITERKKAQALLTQAHCELEKRVKQRTAELDHSNAELKVEIAERKQVEQEIRLLQTITQSIIETPNFNDAIAITLRKICETVDWSYGEAWIPNKQENVLNLNPSWYCKDPDLEEFRIASQKFNFPYNIGKPGRVWATKQSEWTEDVSLQPSKIFLRNNYAQAVGLKTALGVPIIAGEEVIAVFVFFNLSAIPENSQIVELIKSAANQLGLIIERKKAEDALYSSMATNKAILEAIPDLIFRLDRDGIFVNFKAAKDKNLLTPEKKFLGKHIYEIFPQEISQPTMDCVAKALATKEVQIIECQVPTPEKIFSYEVRIAKSDVDEVMAIARDITERKQAEEDIRRTLEQEKNLAELKSRFVTMASHEFRTPLASILSSSELLEHYSHKWSEEKKLSHLYRIQSSVKHMTGLLNDVLLLGKADAGKLKLNPTEINLYESCKDLVEEIQLATTSHQIVFEVENLENRSQASHRLLRAQNEVLPVVEDDDLSRKALQTTEPSYESCSWGKPPRPHFRTAVTVGKCCEPFPSAAKDCYTVCLDEKILRHIISNLLSNAVKYSPESDRVDFSFDCQPQQAVFRVRDYGIGIPPEDLKQLFDSFHRANNVGSIPGTGLGLSIVKRSVELHQGHISVDSRLEDGTTFVVTLPYLQL